ncbi:MAG: hypothetical protein RLZZ373_2650 [Pseudomonadota bacterium]
MSKLIPCKHLDYQEGKYGPDIELQRLGPPYEYVRFWKRGERWTNNGPGHDQNPANVQFCGQGRGQINSILNCYDGSQGHCYEPQQAA